MSEQKMREALERIKVLTEIPFAHTAGDHDLIYQIATEALAQQPAARVEIQEQVLTDDEMAKAVRHLCMSDELAEELVDVSRDEYMAIIAAVEAKKNGGGV